MRMNEILKRKNRGYKVSDAHYEKAMQRCKDNLNYPLANIIEDLVASIGNNSFKLGKIRRDYSADITFKVSPSKNKV